MLKLLYIQFLKSIYSSQEYILASWWIQELGLGEKGKGLVQNKKCKLRSIIITLQEEKRIRNFISMQTLKSAWKSGRD